MSKQSHLLRREGHFYVNRKVPKDLVPVLGVHLIRYALGTSEHKQAVERVRLESAKIDARFAAARRKLNGHRLTHPVTNLTETEVEQMALLWFSDRERSARDAEVNTAPQVGRDDALREAAMDQVTLSDPDDSYTLAAAHAESDRLMEKNGVALQPGSPAHRLLLDLVRRGMLETTRRGADRLSGDYAGQQHDGFFGRSPGTLGDDAGEKISEVRDRWLAENERRWSPATLSEFKATVRMFIEVAGDVPIRGVTRADVREFKDLLVRSPVGFSGKYKGMKLPKAVERADKDPTARRIAAATVNKLMTGLSGMFRWAQDNGFVEGNPAERMRVALGVRPDRQRRQFDADDLGKIFGAPIFQEGRWPERRAERYWLPLLAAFTGARLEELAQLHVDDVRQHDGVWVLSFNIEGGKKLKALSSHREVPLHSVLVKAGFLDYVEEVRVAGHERVFPDLKKGARGAYSQKFSTWFSRFRKSLGIADGNVGFHSFRHSAAQAMREAGVELEMRNAVLGHSQGAMGARYGSGFKPRQTRRAVEKIRYPGLDLDHLKM